MVSPLQIKLANVFVFLLTLFYIIMLGGGNYEQLNVTHIITSDLPKSLAMLQGPYGFNPVKFWVIFRPITIVLFILSLIFNWSISRERRNFLMVSFLIDIATTVATFLYFAPETGMIASISFNDNPVDPTLVARAHLWENLNFIRLGAFYVSSILLLLTINRNVKTA
jgi:hypothetical protein